MASVLIEVNVARDNGEVNATSVETLIHVSKIAKVVASPSDAPAAANATVKYMDPERGGMIVNLDVEETVAEILAAANEVVDAVNEQA